MFQFTKNWFDNTEIRSKINFFINSNEKHHILEIGSYEGASSVYFSEHFLNHPESKMICVDPFLNIFIWKFFWSNIFQSHKIF